MAWARQNCLAFWFKSRISKLQSISLGVERILLLHVPFSATAAHLLALPLTKLRRLARRTTFMKLQLQWVEYGRWMKNGFIPTSFLYRELIKARLFIGWDEVWKCVWIWNTATDNSKTAMPIRFGDILQAMPLWPTLHEKRTQLQKLNNIHLAYIKLLLCTRLCAKLWKFKVKGGWPLFFRSANSIRGDKQLNNYRSVLNAIMKSHTRYYRSTKEKALKSAYLSENRRPTSMKPPKIKII